MLVCAGGAGAMASDPYGANHLILDNVRLDVWVCSYDTGASVPFVPNQPVSGTNVNTSVRASAGLSGTFPSSWEIVYTSWYLVSYEYTIGGHSVGTTLAPMVDEKSDRVRFASTHFPDGTQLPLTVSAQFYLEGIDEEGMIVEDLRVVEATAVVTVHNKGLTWATKEEVTTALGFHVPPTEYPDGYAPASRRGAHAANGSFLESNHAVLNQDSNVQTTTEAQLANWLKTATYILGFTHGEPTNVRSSQSDQLFFNYAPLQMSEIRGYVTNGRTVPLPNIVVMHACETLAQTYHAPFAFAVHDIDPNITYVNRAYAGYPVVVWSLGYKGNFAIDVHAEAVYRYLREGLVLSKAVEQANAQFPQQSSSGVYLAMLWRGDEYARIKKVYNGAEVSNSWFYAY